VSAPSEAYKIKLVKVQPGASIASTPEPDLAPGTATFCREAKARGHQAATQVKELSPEILVVPEADGFHVLGRQQVYRCKRLGDKRLAGSETVAWCQNDFMGTWESLCIPERGSGKQVEETRMQAKMHGQSDQLVVVMKQGNSCGAKGLTDSPRNDSSFQSPMRHQMKLLRVHSGTPATGAGCLKSRMRENRTYGSVRGLIVGSNAGHWRGL